MELRKWRYFLVAAEEVSFGRAAYRLNVTQPALSQHIHELEQELGVLLFDRIPRGVRLSQAGLAFVEEARRVLGDIDHAIDRARRTARGELGVLRIAYNETCAQLPIVAEALDHFRKLSPGVAMTLAPLNGVQQHDALQRDAIDIGFHHQPDDGRSYDWISTVRMQTHYFVLVISNQDRLASKKRISVRDLAEQVMITSTYRSWDPPIRDYLHECFAAIGFIPSRLLETGSDLAAVNLASVGMGVGIVLSSHHPSDKVAVRNLPGRRFNLNAVLGWRRENRSPHLLSFVEVVRKVVWERRASLG